MPFMTPPFFSFFTAEPQPFSRRIPQVDLERMRLSVDDDGAGMTYANVQRAGLLHHTSKVPPRVSLAALRLAPTFGFRGEALAALQQVAVLAITTRDPETGLTWCKTAHRGNALALHPANSPRTSRGTRVELHDIFGTLPVRRQSIVPAAELQRCRLRVAAVALARTDVAVTLVDAARGVVLLKTPGSRGPDETPEAERQKWVFGRIIGTERARSLQPVEQWENGMSLRGYIATVSHWTPELQVGVIGESVFHFDSEAHFFIMCRSF